MAVFPYLRDREKATDVLIACVHDRDPETSGNGNVPLYATTYLANMAATRAIPDVAGWVNFLKANPDYDKNPNKVLEKKAAEDLRRLTQAAATRPAS
jgi:hypothetical protein